MDSPLLHLCIFIAWFTLESSFSSNGDQNCTHHYKQVLTHTCSEALRLSQGSSYKQFEAGEPYIPHMVWWAPTATYGVRIQKLKQRIASYSAKKQDSTFAHILQGWCMSQRDAANGWWPVSRGTHSLTIYMCLSEVGEGILGLSIYASCPAHFLFPVNVLFASLSIFLWLIPL